MNPSETAPVEQESTLHPRETTQVSPTPDELFFHFNQQADAYALMLDKLNRSFEEKLAALATKQLIAKLA